MKSLFGMLIVCVLTGSVALAGESFKCLKDGKFERTLEVAYTGEEGKAPCEVRYQKVGEGETEPKVLYKASFDAKYCLDKATEFAEKTLKDLGWECTGEKAAAAKQAGTEAPAAKEPVTEAPAAKPSGVEETPKTKTQ